MTKSLPVRFAIIGCGFIGEKRLANLPRGSVACVYDIDRARAERLAEKAGGGCRVAESVAAAVGDVDAVIVATVNAALAPASMEAIRAGKHVLVEKPAALSSKEIREMKSAAEARGTVVRVGFNHRYHPAFLKARELVGEIGSLMFIRARYGHGGRLGYDREWRADPKISGGGELIDQGVHLIDLARWFLGDFTFVQGHATTCYWDMPVDDNAFLNLRTKAGQTAWLHVSCSEWKNLFSFEVYGRNGKLHIEGLGGSYGVERLYHYRMLEEMGPPETVVYEYPRGDMSWKLEMEEFVAEMEGGKKGAGLEEAAAAMEIVEQVYEQSGMGAGAWGSGRATA